MDLLDRLLGHDRWTTTQLLERCRELRAEQWTEPFDLGHQTLAAIFQHMIGNVRVWIDLMAERPVRQSSDEALVTANDLITAWQRAYDDFAALACTVRDQGRWECHLCRCARSSAARQDLRRHDRACHHPQYALPQ
jgi:uncharacterized damage-inducible protein DinB